MKFISAIMGAIGGLAACAVVCIYTEHMPHHLLVCWIALGCAPICMFIAGRHSYSATKRYYRDVEKIRGIKLSMKHRIAAWGSGIVIGVFGGYLMTGLVLGLPLVMHCTIPGGTATVILVFISTASLFGRQAYRDTVLHYCSREK